MSNGASSKMHAQVEMLLPWYVNGTLSAAGYKRVQAHLDICDECRDGVLWCASMRAAAQQEGPVPILPATRAAHIIDGDRERDVRQVQWSSWQRWSVAAAFGLVALFGLYSGGPGVVTDASNQQFDAASTSGRVETVDYVLLLRFADAVSVSDRASIVEDLGVGHSMLNGDQAMIKIIVRLPPKSLHELEQYAAAIQSRHEIVSAEVIALQLPLR